MKSKILLVTSIFLLGLNSFSASTFEVEKLKWDNEYYVVDRKMAQKDPYLGLQKLIGGNKRFFEGKSIKPRQDEKTMKSLNLTQNPFAVIISCSDSRVPNEIVFDQGVGDLFIIRTAGQVSSAASFGSIEYAVEVLKTKLVVVMGHSQCGAVAAAVKKPKVIPGHIVTLINDIKPSAEKCKGLPGDHVENTVRQNVIDQVNRLRNLEPVLANSFSEGKILIVGAIYNIDSGKVEFLKETLIDLPKFKP